jgi:hypothetical protein
MNKPRRLERSTICPPPHWLFPGIIGGAGITYSGCIGTGNISVPLEERVPLGDPFYVSFDSDFYAPWCWLRWFREYGNSSDPLVRHVVRHETAWILVGIVASILAAILLDQCIRRCEQ